MNQEMKETMLSSDSISQQNNHAQNASKISKSKQIVCWLTLILVVGLIALVAISLFTMKQPTEIYPLNISMAVMYKEYLQMEEGTSRMIQTLFYSGNDNRSSEQFKVVTKRNIQWVSDSPATVAVDQYGRIDALTTGLAKIQVRSLDVQGISDYRIIKVIHANQTKKDNITKNIVNYTKKAAGECRNRQKIVLRFSKDEALKDQNVPQSIKDVIQDEKAARKTKMVVDENISWEIMGFADGSDRKYVVKTDMNVNVKERDRRQYYMGLRYLPGDGTSPISIEDDKSNGVWVVEASGKVNHIQRKSDITYYKKSILMVNSNNQYVSRHGVASGATYDTVRQKWIPEAADNDGLWTSMFAVGDLMRYAVLKRTNTNQEDIASARNSSLRALKAVLMISNIPGREGTVDAKLRYLNNTRTEEGARYNESYLKQNKTYAIQNNVRSPASGIGFYGNDAGKAIDGAYRAGIDQYSLRPLNEDDWTQTEKPATSKRTIKGFIARNFMIAQLDGDIEEGGLYFRRNANGTQTVISGANDLYDYKPNEHPILSLGNSKIPEVLMDVINVNGVQYNISSMIYKGDTSTDQIIGHLFVYKVAFDILDENDPQEKALKSLVTSTICSFCQMLIDNGYSFVDATGQGTTWGKLIRDFLNSDFTIEDGQIKSLELLMSFKVCHYVSKQAKWQSEYMFLIEHPAFRYLDLTANIWKRFQWMALNEDFDVSQKLYRLDDSLKPSDVQRVRHAMYQIHYSDEEEAMLGYYLAFQLETNQTLLQKYREGIDGWWNSMSQSENPLWYYIYQLAYPTKQKVLDAFGNPILETASWQLNRHPIQMVNYAAFVEGSRSDVLLEGGKDTLSIDPSKPITKRTSPKDVEFAKQRKSNEKVFPNYDPKTIYQIKILPHDERSIHKFNGATFQNIFDGGDNYMEPSTTYTLPYWLGVYHNLLEFN